MSLAHGQPRVRFAERFNPGDMAGLAFTPKVITVEKDLSGGAEAWDFWSAPAGVFIQQVFAYVLDAATGTSPTVEIGLDGNPDEFIDTSDFDISTVGNWATNIGSTVATSPNGLYLPSGDVLRMTIVGTDLSAGTIRAVISYFETDDMFDRGPHFLD